MAKTRVAPDPNVAANLTTLMGVYPELATQQQVAKKSGVGQTTIGRILRGEVSPTSDNLRKIAEAFNVDLGYLYYRPAQFEARLREGTLRKLLAELSEQPVAHDVSYTPITNLPITP